VWHAPGVDFLDEYAEALSHPGAPEVDASEEERRILLRLAREVAHRTERVNAPLSTYLAGRFVAERVREGMAPSDAARRALEVAEEMLPGLEPGA
jgi:hypothetical protein